MKKVCAIYTRKSTDERLDMEFNTLDAQREACEAYIISQKSEGWIASNKKYDDAGFSGGSMDRPALNILLHDIRAGRIQTIVVYKIDRLTRSLMDFSKLVQVFDEYGVTFVSITQSFNTTTSMGRLTLNVLLSFAQFEREVSGERIRDKIAASKAKGMWMGGVAPVGYMIENRQLVKYEPEIKLARHIFERYLELKSVLDLKRELELQGIKSPVRKSLKGKIYGDMNFSRGALYAILKNPAYIGKISHKGKIHEGLHEGIIAVDLWQQVQTQLRDQTVARTVRTKHRHMLQGLIFDPDGTVYSPTFTKRHGRQYRYYISQNLAQNRAHPYGIMSRLPAQEIETFIEAILRKEIARLVGEKEGSALAYILTHHHIIPGQELVRSCVDRVTVGLNTVEISINPTGFKCLVDTHLNLKVTGESETFRIDMPFTVGKGRSGAVVIEPDGPKDIFDLPPTKLKKLIQGVIWRDEHFDGLTLKEIAHREGCSEGYVGTAIFSSFDILQSAQSPL